MYDCCARYAAARFAYEPIGIRSTDTETKRRFAASFYLHLFHLRLFALLMGIALPFPALFIHESAVYMYQICGCAAACIGVAGRLRLAARAF